jgi:hypothetical protein
VGGLFSCWRRLWKTVEATPLRSVPHLRRSAEKERIMHFDRSEYRIVVASDVSTRDGIGVEISRGEDLLIEIFRDDTNRTKVITAFSNQFSLDEMEGFIQIFRDEIPSDFIEYNG